MLDAAKIRSAKQILRHAGLPAVALGLSVLAGAGINYLSEPALKHWQGTSHTSDQGSHELGGSLMAVERVAVEPVKTQRHTPAPTAHAPAPVTPTVPTTSAAPALANTTTVTTSLEASVTQAVMPHASSSATTSVPAAKIQTVLPDGYRIFNGRIIRPARTMTMVTTAYSPDERSCGPNADGTTASGKSVWTNGMKMAAADTRVLPFGTLISVPGYYDDQPVPVLDRGGAIKGRRLDMLYPTHEIAKKWGRQKQTVTIWEYVD